MRPSLDKQSAVWATSATLIGTRSEDFKTATDYNSMEQICEVVNGRVFGCKLDSTLLGHAVTNIYAANS